MVLGIVCRFSVFLKDLNPNGFHVLQKYMHPAATYELFVRTKLGVENLWNGIHLPVDSVCFLHWYRCDTDDVCPPSNGALFKLYDQEKIFLI
jgi:hypothetical protein